MSSPTTFFTKLGSDGVCVPPAQMSLMSSVFCSRVFRIAGINGEYFLVKSANIMAGLHALSLSKSLTPPGLAHAFPEATSTGFDRRVEARLMFSLLFWRNLLPQ